MLKNILEGKPLRHPVHPFLVHFPIGLFVLSLLLDVAGRIWPDFSGLAQGAYYSMAAGVATALLAAVPGFVDYLDIRRDHPARKIAITHMILNLVAVGIYAVNLGVRYPPRDSQPGMLALILSIIAVLILSVSGHLGGKLVFDNGIAVGRHRRKTATPEDTIRLGAAGGDGFVKAASEKQLRDGETLRLSIDNTVIVLARSGGKFYAFQEFCTHRFGPLSEGRIRDCEIECPWHCSKFDMRTGKVTQAPAKEPLKCFEVQVRGGDVFVSPKPFNPAPVPAPAR